MRPILFAATMILAGISSVFIAESQIPTTSPHSIEFYVAPGGNDDSPGTMQRPFRTLDRARDAVRIMKRTDGALHAPVDIILRGGTYRLPAPFVLKPEDGGTAQTPVTYRAYPGETPVLSGGVTIKNWRPDKAQRPECVDCPHRKVFARRTAPPATLGE